MCGRYSITTAPEALARLFETEGPLPNFAPRWNVAPTQDAPVVRREDGTRRLAMLRWGLIPHWSRGADARYSMINARADTVADKPAYRASVRDRRCLVPADGFYEWTADGKAKQPWRIHMAGDAPFAFAGLWDRWQPRDGGGAIESFTIVTTDANATLRPIHDRMPVVLDPSDWERWLAGELDEALALLRPAPDGLLAAYRVSSRVNTPRNDDAELFRPLASEAPAAARLL